MLSILALAVTGFATSTWLNYVNVRNLWEERARDLMQQVEIAAQLLLAVSDYDREHSPDFPGGPLEATLTQFRKGLSTIRMQAGHGDFVIGRRQGQQIVFVFNEEISAGTQHSEVPWDSDLAVPMRLALQGHSGTVRARDFSGTEVYAAYRAVPSLGLGVVSKIAVAEIEQPAISNSLSEGAIIALLVIVASALTLGHTLPILRQLGENERRFRSYFEQGLIGIAEVSPRGEWIRVNHELTRMLGYHVDALQGLTWEQLTHPDDLVHERPLFEALIRHEREGYTFEKRLLHRADRFVHAIAAVRGVWSTASTPDYVIMTLLDISDRVRAEQVARQAQKMESLGVLLAGVAHEINNPLMGLSSYLEAARAEATSPTQSNYLDKAGQQVERIAGLMRNTLAFAHRDGDQPQTADLTEVMDHTLRLLDGALRDAGIRVEYAPPSPTLPVQARAEPLQQVLVNLLLNARDALEHAALKLIAIRVREEREQVVITIHDSGPGIPPHLRPMIFEPFFTTKPAGVGTGIGLAISRQIVRDFKGELRFEGNVEGAMFEIHLKRPTKTKGSGS